MIRKVINKWLEERRFLYIGWWHVRAIGDVRVWVDDVDDFLVVHDGGHHFVGCVLFGDPDFFAKVEELINGY